MLPVDERERALVVKLLMTTLTSAFRVHSRKS